MKPERAQELYSDYKEATLSPALKLALEQHFESDPAARQDYEDFAQIFDVLDMPEGVEVEVPHGFRAKVMERAALEQGKRAQASTGTFAALLDLFRQPRKRQAALVMASVVGVAVISGVVLSGNQHSTVAPGSTNPLMLPNAGASLIDPSQPIVQSVTSRPDASGVVYHDFLLHLPKLVRRGTVDAYAVSSTQQIRDASIRERQAKVIVKSQAIQHGEDLTIPVAAYPSSTSGSTLNVVFDIHMTGYDGRTAEREVVVFTPMNPDDSVSTSSQAPVNGGYFDSLQTLAGDYHVTIIVGTSGIPDSVQPWSSGDGIEPALSTVVGSGNDVKAVDGQTYFIYRKS